MAAPFLPPLIAFAAATVSAIAGGVGDAVTFHTLWTLAGAVGLIPLSRLRKAVLYASLVPLSNMPLMLYRSWDDVCRYRSWGFLVAAAAAITTPIGARLLLSVDVLLIKRVAGLVFFFFGVLQLWPERREKEGAQSINSSSAPGSGHGGTHLRIESGDDPLEHASPVVGSSTAPELDADTVQIKLDVSAYPQNDDLSTARAASLWLGVFPPLTKRYSPRVAAVVLVVGGLVSGLLGGLLGTSGPPLIVAYSVLALDKDAVRGVTVSMQSIVIFIRMYSLIAGRGSVFDWAGEASVYCALVVCAWAGLALGTSLRKYCDSRAILRVLSTLLIVSAVSMLGLFESGLAGAALLAALAVLVVALLRTLGLGGHEAAAGGARGAVAGNNGEGSLGR